MKKKQKGLRNIEGLYEENSLVKLFPTFSTDSNIYKENWGKKSWKKMDGSLYKIKSYEISKPILQFASLIGLQISYFIIEKLHIFEFPWFFLNFQMFVCSVPQKTRLKGSVACERGRGLSSWQNAPLL